MRRSSQHILKYANIGKINYLELLFQDYISDLQSYIDLIWNKKLPLKKFLSSKKLPALNCVHSHYKSIIYKQASEIIRSQRKRKTKTKPEIKNVSINLDKGLYHLSNNSKKFDEFLQISLPYKSEGFKNRYEKIRIPIKYHRQSLKFKDWNRKTTIQLKKINGNYYVIFFYEKESFPKREQGKKIGIDIGYKKLIVTSDNQFFGNEMEQLYQRLSEKKQGSKNFNQLLIYRNNEINRICNSLDLSEVQTIYVENLKNVKHKSKFSKKFNNKLQRWSYPKVISKLERMTEEQGINLEKVSPAYTSQTCSKCGVVDKKSRRNSVFLCTACGMELDADFNAARNVLYRGVFENPLPIKSCRKLL